MSEYNTGVHSERDRQRTHRDRTRSARDCCARAPLPLAHAARMLVIVVHEPSTHAVVLRVLVCVCCASGCGCVLVWLRSCVRGPRRVWLWVCMRVWGMLVDSSRPQVITFALLWPLYLSQLAVFRFTPPRKRNKFKMRLILIGVVACFIGSLRACDPNSGLGLISVFVSRSLYQEFGITCLYSLVLVMLSTAKTLFVQMQRPMPAFYKYGMWGLVSTEQFGFIPAWIYVQMGVSRQDDDMQMRGWVAQGILWMIISGLLLILFLILYARLTRRVRAFLITLQNIEDKKMLSAAAISANTAELALEASRLSKFQPTSPPAAAAATKAYAINVPIEEEPDTETEPDLPRSPSNKVDKPTRVRPGLLIVTTKLQQQDVDPASPLRASQGQGQGQGAADETVVAQPNASPRPAGSRNSAAGPVTRAPTLSAAAAPTASRANPPAASSAPSAAASSAPSASQSQDRINDLHRALNKLHILAVLVTLLLVGTIAASVSRIIGYIHDKQVQDLIVHNPQPDDSFPPMNLLTMAVNQGSLATIVWYGWSSTKVLFRVPFWDTMIHGPPAEEIGTQFDGGATRPVKGAPTSKNSKGSRIKPAPTAAATATAGAAPGAPTVAVQLATLPVVSPTSKDSQAKQQVQQGEEAEEVVAAQIPLDTGADSAADPPELATTAVAAANGTATTTRTAW